MLPETITPDVRFLQQVEAAGPFQASACYQCRKCTNGCPVSFAMDLYPDEVIRLVIVGLPQTVLHSQTIWVCAACETCTTRCPNDVKIAELMDCLKETAVQKGIPCPHPQILDLHNIFLKDLKRWGRVCETTFIPEYLLRSGMLRRMWQAHTLGAEIKLGWRMGRKGRFALLPKTIKGKKEVRNILGRPEKR
ncbi:MAG: heterodisulfide reductase [Deltaproteobacteria bacterium SG8_13]|nr:MAG: heterodisulfide reductase [Deltaproteobacteria bacterium SG8_13]